MLNIKIRSPVFWSTRFLMFMINDRTYSFGREYLRYTFRGTLSQISLNVELPVTYTYLVILGFKATHDLIFIGLILATDSHRTM